MTPSETRERKAGRDEGTDPNQHQTDSPKLCRRNRLGMEYDNGDEAETSKREALAKPGRWARVEAIRAIPHQVLIVMLQPCGRKRWSCYDGNQ